MEEQNPLKSVHQEFLHVNLGDARLNRRLMKNVEVISMDPAKSFPKLMTSAELEGFYQLLNNEKTR